MRRPLSTVLARLPYKRPFTIGVAAVLLVCLVGAGVAWQLRAHAAAASLVVTSDAGIPYSPVLGGTGSAVVAWAPGSTGCGSVDGNGICTSGNFFDHQAAYPGAHWIWATPQWDPDVQGGSYITFTKQFTIPESALDMQGTLTITGHTFFDVQINGDELGSGNDYTTAYTFPLTGHLVNGTNVITVEAANATFPPVPSLNPAGVIFRADISYSADSTAPTTAATISGTLGSHGWYISPVNVTLAATDPDDAASTLHTTFSLDNGSTWNDYTGGALSFALDGQYTLQYRSVDPATNLEATKSLAFNIDQTPPDLHVSGAASGTLDFCAGALPVRPSFAPTDATSGIDSTSTGDSWTTPSSATHAGAYTYEAHAVDMAGNTTSEKRTYTVQYGAAYSGVLDPVNASGVNSFNLSRTVPVKFQLMCNGSPISTAVASLAVKQGTGTAATKAPKKLSTVNTFTYDPVAQQYQLNVSMGSGYTNPDGTIVTFAPGTWTFTIMLDDGSAHDFTVQLS